MREMLTGWLRRSDSEHTRLSYLRDLQQFMKHSQLDIEAPEQLVRVRPQHVAAWRDDLKARGYTNASIRRKLTTLRACFAYLQVYGYVGANPAHGKYVKAPSVPRDGKTVGLSPKACRLLLEAPDQETIGQNAVWR